MDNLTKGLMLGWVLAIGVAGVMYGVVTISTKPASHDAYLTTLVVGQKEETQTLQLDTPQQRLIIPQKLIAGETNNQIDPRAQYAVVAGGNENKIGVDADSAAIGAGYSNEVNARRASIGAGYDNTVGSGGDNAFIGGGDQNKVFISNGVIVGWRRNELSALGSVIPWGITNTITAAAAHSFAAGEQTKLTKTGTFGWSDYDTDYIFNWTPQLTPAKDYTFLVRALNGMAINTGSIPAGVNVGVAGAVHLEGEGKLGTGTCTQNLAGTFEVENGCFYFCDGRYRQSLNVAFNELMAVDKKECRYIERCEFDGIWLRPWDQVMAYKEPRSENCGGIKTTLECGKDAAKFSMYPYSYCMPYNSGTSLDIINTYHP